MFGRAAAARVLRCFYHDNALTVGIVLRNLRLGLFPSCVEFYSDHDRCDKTAGRVEFCHRDPRDAQPERRSDWNQAVLSSMRSAASVVALGQSQRVGAHHGVMRPEKS